MENAFIVVTPKAGGDVVELPQGSAVDLQAPSAVKIAIGPEEVAAFDQSGMDLIITLKSGEKIVISDFFNVSEGERSELLLEDSDEVVWWGQYESPWSGFSFAEIQEAAELAGGIPAWAVVAGVLGAAGVAAVAADSDSDSDSDSGSDGDGSDGDGSDGDGDGSDGDGDGSDGDGDGSDGDGDGSDGDGDGSDGDGDGSDGDGDGSDGDGDGSDGDGDGSDGDGDGSDGDGDGSDGDGDGSDGDGSDGDGDGSDGDPVSDGDNIAPDAPTVGSVVNTLDENGEPDGTTVSGTAEPNSTVHIRDPDTGDVVGKGTADNNGNYEVTTDTPLEDGKAYDVVAIDDAGNVSEPITETGDTTAPDAPTVDSVTNTFDDNGVPDGTTVSGTAEPNSAVEIRDPDTGDVVGTGEADENGNYEITTDEPLEDGKDYDVVAIDDTGNVSEPATATGDITAPDAPTVDSVTNTLDENGVPDGTTVSGTAEPNSVVEIRDPDTGDVVGTGEADDNGNYEITTDEPLEDGKDYDVVAIDDTGNVSEPATATGDITAPD
ncbi:Ig-like domain-containing protein, partial [Halomonas sp. THAF12]|uniref:Ig-like domain-containing protein n=1 Tax=Halomonas sp. B23F22_10 TaxID=3459515 RepID=UPI00373E805C